MCHRRRRGVLIQIGTADSVSMTNETFVPLEST
jgi:hypothetical protein